MKTLLSIVFIFVFSFVAFGQANSQEVDLSIYAFDLTDPIKLGSRQNIRYQIFVFNSSKVTTATGVIVTAVLPPSLMFASAETDSGRCLHSEGVITCNLGAVRYNSIDYSALIHISARPTELGIVKLTTSIQGNEPDPVTSNNTSTATTTVIELKSRKRLNVF